MVLSEQMHSVLGSLYYATDDGRLRLLIQRPAPELIAVINRTTDPLRIAALLRKLATIMEERAAQAGPVPAPRPTDDSVPMMSFIADAEPVDISATATFTNSDTLLTFAESGGGGSGSDGNHKSSSSGVQ